MLLLNPYHDYLITSLKDTREDRMQFPVLRCLQRKDITTHIHRTLPKHMESVL